MLEWEQVMDRDELRGPSPHRREGLEQMDHGQRPHALLKPRAGAQTPGQLDRPPGPGDDRRAGVGRYPGDLLILPGRADHDAITDGRNLERAHELAEVASDTRRVPSGQPVRE